MPLHRNRLAALLATLAMALQSFWPFIAQARPRTPGELVPVCTVAGITHYLELPAQKSPLAERSATHGKHCKLCVFGADRTAVVPPAQVSPLIADEASVCVRALPQSSSLQSLSHAPAQPRAPPFVS